MLKTKKSSLPSQILELAKVADVRVNLISKERDATIKGKSLNGFLGEEKRILREWDVQSFTVLLPVSATVEVVEEEPAIEDKGVVE